ncbi:MAG: hypothetical protein BWY53_00434 [Parcubacteria group bacterium ADurb.Bin326]|nr:MAG: hypothetical protein BWY53_00434 [Parcubacteria group bacterium ADurb.Bin326]
MPKKTGGRKKDVEEISSLAEKKYVSIKEIDPQTSTKKTILWTSVTALSLILVSAWFVLLRMQVEKSNEGLEFLSLVNQISESVRNFDDQLKDNSLAIIPEDINKLKEGIIEELKQSVDSSLWPTKQLDQLKLSIQLPTEWTANLKNNEAALTASSSSSTIGISLAKNTGSLPLTSWIEKNNPEILSGYLLKEPIFKFTEQSGEALYYTNEQATTTIDFIYLINSTSTKSVYLIKAFSPEPTEKEKRTIEEIIKTVKILK